jgi:hypothetical protein
MTIAAQNLSRCLPTTYPDHTAQAIPDEHMPVLRFVPPVMDRRSQEQQHQRSDPRAESRVGDPVIGTRSRLARFLGRTVAV